ncbi:GntR family transcriptional regulator [Nonomuraea muscovyensis]
MDAMTLKDIAQVKDPLERARALSRLMAEQQDLLAEAAELRRAAVAEARESGHPAEPDDGAAGPTSRAARVVVRRALPTEPAVRASASLFLAEAERQGIEAGRRMLYVGPEPAADHVAACLRVEPGAEVIARRKMMTADGVPVRIATSYFRADLFGGTRLAEPGFVRPSLQSALVALGHAFGHAEETLTARPPTPFEHRTLELDPGEWIVQVLRAGYSTGGTPVHVLETICAATRHVFPIGQVSGHDEF